MIPLDPSPDRARALLRRELLHPEYHAQNPVEQLLHWLQRQLESGMNTAAQAPPLGATGAVVAFGALLVVLGLLVSRARRTARAPAEAGALLTTERVSSGQLRERARAALAAGDARTAVVEGFRALTLRQIERGWIEDQPGATAHEFAARLGGVFESRRPDIAAAADLFDRVRYGDRPATADQASSVLELDLALAELVGAR